MQRRQYLSAVGATVTTGALAGCSGDSSSESDSGEDGNTEANEDNGNSGDELDNAFGVVASNTADEKIPIDGRVEENSLSGYEVVDHIGMVSGSGVVILSVRVENVGSETPRLTSDHTFWAEVHGTNGDMLFGK